MFQIREATPDEAEAMLALFPRLADFEIPAQRTAEHLWQGDAALLQAWSRGEAPQCLVWVAVDDDNAILGVALVSLREELLSHEPSAHLEVIVVDERADGQGIGRALVNKAEQVVREQGALTMTLHVFANNTRARQVYERLEYSGELIRYIKYLK